MPYFHFSWWFRDATHLPFHYFCFFFLSLYYSSLLIPRAPIEDETRLIQRKKLSIFHRYLPCYFTRYPSVTIHMHQPFTLRKNFAKFMLHFLPWVLPLFSSFIQFFPHSILSFHLFFFSHIWMLINRLITRLPSSYIEFSPQHDKKNLKKKKQRDSN